MTRNFFIGGNWKMNGSVAEVNKLVELLNNIDVPANTGK
jgi:triosephosphate isomerase